ncbi:hypothetical protein FDP08_03120 [Marinobacter panjinensis]|uniref:Uncharacterized protein n=1 Tax=Marinobacter panjinensis TaxID=2576384 RepID=A0A4U6R2X1_9GAMM|nr:hypothetical protein [Marinobacter panjinensis]MCR8915878.1 hypothetical protein [Marinobacter panjinensis]TKV67152.1 hypothetical protein FDP08_03120 [Marinobacter panjinensis]
MKTCNRIGKRFVSAFIIGFTISTAAFAQDAIQMEDHVLSDGKLDITEVGAVVATAQNHLKKMTEAAVKAAEEELEEAGIFRPMAFMFVKSSGEVRKMKLDGEGEDAPSHIKVLMYRAGLKSLARHGEIHAGLVAYPGSLEKNGETLRTMVVEHEHRLGVSGLKLIPVKLDKGEVTFGEAMSQDKQFQFFYDSEEGSKK